MNENKLFGIRNNETGETSLFTEDDVYAAARKGAWEDCTELISILSKYEKLEFGVLNKFLV